MAPMCNTFDLFSNRSFRSPKDIDRQSACADAASSSLPSRPNNGLHTFQRNTTNSHHLCYPPSGPDTGVRTMGPNLISLMPLGALEEYRHGCLCPQPNSPNLTLSTTHPASAGERETEGERKRNREREREREIKRERQTQREKQRKKHRKIETKRSKK